MKILIDNGHGKETPGKRSPDKRIMEWEWNREIASGIKNKLVELGYDAELIVPEDKDISLSERVRRVNTKAKSVSGNTFLVSIHINAAGSDGKYHDAKGWSVFVSNNASGKSKKLADSIFDSFFGSGLKTRKPKPTQKYWQSNLYILKNTSCPAVLTENFFMDNLEDEEYILSNEGKEKIIDLHVKGIINYIKTL